MARVWPKQGCALPVEAVRSVRELELRIAAGGSPDDGHGLAIDDSGRLSGRAGKQDCSRLAFPCRTKCRADLTGQLENVRSRPVRNLIHGATFCWVGKISRAVRRSIMNEVDELFTAMLAILFAGVMLIAGGLYIDNMPVQPPTVPAAQMASAP